MATPIGEFMKLGLNSPCFPPAFRMNHDDDDDDGNRHSVDKPKKEKRKYRCRKRSPATIERAKTVRRDKANARERRRMNSLNDALEVLRTMIPSLPDEPKMTKIETLRKAREYISHLSTILGDDAEQTTSHDNFELTSNNTYELSSSCYSAPCSAPSSLDPTPYTSPCFPPAPFQSPHFDYYPHYSNR